MAQNFHKIAEPPAECASSKTMPKSLKILKGECLPMDEPPSLDSLASRIKSRLESCAAETGMDLLKAKEMLAHGAFQPWLKTNFGWSLSHAQNLMNVAKDPQSAKFGDLPKAAQYLLAAPSASETAKNKTVAELQAGKKLSVAEIKTTLQEAKPSYAQKQEAKATQQSVADKAVKAINPNIGVAAAKLATHQLVDRLKYIGLNSALDAVRTAFPGVIISTMDTAHGG